MIDLITESIHHRSLNGLTLVKMREAKGISQYELAGKIGISQGMICRLERPGRHEIKTKLANKIYEALK